MNQKNVIQLRPQTTCLITDDSGSQRVYKRLPEDCCPRGQLHPSIEQRLRKLCELPVAAFVNLIGVERTERGIELVSEYVPGTPLTELSSSDISKRIPDLRQAVIAMHQHGMVHGAIKPSNIILEPSGRLRLIDPSPFLHDDPQEDWTAVELLDEHRADDAPDVDADHRMDRGVRRRSILAAAALGMVAVGAGVAVAIYLGG